MLKRMLLTGMCVIVAYFFVQGKNVSKTNAAVNKLFISSPDKKIKVSFGLSHGGCPFYRIDYKNQIVIDTSYLGLGITGRQLANDLFIGDVSTAYKVSARYKTFNAKKSHIVHTYMEKSFTLKNKNDSMIISFRVSNDGVAFRYFIPTKEGLPIIISKENTQFHFPLDTKAFLQPVAIAKSGWEQTNPSYEEYYEQNIPVGTEEMTGAGWVYPALFHTGTHWVLITEAALEGNYCATRLAPRSDRGIYSIAFPDAREVITEKNGLLPYSDSSLYTPWRVISIGTLKTIAESTLGTDMASPARFMAGYAKPGKSSWSWIMSKDDYITYAEQKKYIDFAARMSWEYCLVDADWDRKIGYEKIAELAKYAASKEVGLLLWYNSAGDWNTVKYTPKDKLLTHKSRMSEFSKLKEMDIKGIKVDFLGGDGRSVVQYYIDILRDAATYGLMVNFHGATLPRGWARTYPNLMSTEAVKGFEMVTFDQKAADVEANHVAMLPFTRNAFDPMDFTPMNLYKIPTSVMRKTTSGFELATSVLLLSGIQHYAESPDGMEKMPDYVQQFLRDLPTYWDDVKFIDGYPGKYAVIARRHGTKWYIAGINAKKEAMKIQLNLDFLSKKAKKILLVDGDTSNTSIKQSVFRNGDTIMVLPNGGFVIVAQ